MIRSTALAPDDRADESVRKILGDLLDALESKVAGVLDDLDTEFLHDLRVANRRTRTALSQIKGVLPAHAVDSFSPEFKWVGTITGPCRDLDVILLEIVAYQSQSAIDDHAVGSLRHFLEGKRKGEHERVAAALRSARFRRLIEDWGVFLESATDGNAEPPRASSPIIGVAGPRILKAYKRIRKRGAGAGADAPATVLHRLRIDGKKLRYLLEFFSDLYPHKTVSRFIRALKRLQDILGEFNDAQVQLALIDEFVDQSASSSATIPTMTPLINAITKREIELRAVFVSRFALFAGEDSRRLYTETFKAT